MDHEHLATLGTPVVERVIELLREKGGTTRLRLDGLYLKKEGFADALSRCLSFPNSKAIVQRSLESTASYMILHLHYGAVSESREEGLVSVCLNESSLTEIQGLVGHHALHGASARPFQEPVARRPFAEILGKAATIVKRLLAERLAPYQQSLERRRARDHERIVGYFRDLVREQEHLSKKAHTPEDRDLVAEKIRATLAARDFKLAELNERYKITVTVRAVAACRLLIPVATLPVLLRVGRSETTRIFYWNPLLKEIEPTSCDHCGQATFVVFAGRNLVLTCKDCHERIA
jgi:hypothetical protein